MIAYFRTKKTMSEIQTTEILNTPLTEIHIALGAKMAAFAGYNMPISYSSIKEEHKCVREAVGVFDVSHMGEFILRGKDALEVLQMVSSNDASKLEINQAQYACLPNEQGGIVDDFLAYRLSEDFCAAGEKAFMLVVNASNIDKDFAHVARYAAGKAVTFLNISDQTGLLALQGPKAHLVLQKLTDIDLKEIAYYHSSRGVVAGISNVIISNTGYTGSGGFELYVHEKDTVKLWNALFEAGAEFGILPIGLGARDTLRLEKGFNLYGNDIDDTTNPIEAGLGWVTKLNKENFVAKNIIEQIKMNGVTRKLVGFTLNERRVPRHGYAILNSEGTHIGVVTSGTSSPTLDIPIGMGYVATENAKLGSIIFIDFGTKKLEATIVKTPFVK